jgi:hypothetical protein
MDSQTGTSTFYLIGLLIQPAPLRLLSLSAPIATLVVGLSAEFW